MCLTFILNPLITTYEKPYIQYSKLKYEHGRSQGGGGFPVVFFFSPTNHFAIIVYPINEKS